MNLILFGFKSCGKSYFGKLLAEATGYAFIDTDRLIEQLYEKEYQEHLKFRQIYLKIGSTAFRELERRAIQSLEKVDKAIIAVGGGAIFDPYNREMLEKIGQLIYLEVDKAVLKKRILSNELPAYLDPKDPEGSFESMYETRLELYEKIAATKVHVSGKADQTIIEELRGLLIHG